MRKSQPLRASAGADFITGTAYYSQPSNVSQLNPFTLPTTRWQAQIQCAGKKTHLGHYLDQEEAARKYDEEARKLGRHVNFPNEGDIQAIKGGRGGKSRFKGVSWHLVTNKWEAGIKIDGKKTGLGHFTDEVEAAHRYDEAAAKLGRPLNFPPAGYAPSTSSAAASATANGPSDVAASSSSSPDEAPAGDAGAAEAGTERARARAPRRKKEAAAAEGPAEGGTKRQRAGKPGDAPKADQVPAAEKARNVASL